MTNDIQNTTIASPEIQQNTAHVVEDAGQTVVQVERHEPKSVEGVLIVDLTASRQDTRDAFIADFTKGSGEFEELVKKVSSIGNVALTLIVHNGEGTRTVGRYESPKQLGEALAQIKCVSSHTQIAQSFDLVPKNAHFIIVNGDTTDGDIVKTLVEKAGALGIPVIPLVEHTTGHSGTTQADIEALKQMGEASGVLGGPFSYQTRMSLLDFVAVSAAAVQGPAAVEELKATGAIPEEVWKAVPPQAVESIVAAAAPETTAPETVSAAKNTVTQAPATTSRFTNKNGVQLVGNIGDGAVVTIHYGAPAGETPAIAANAHQQRNSQNRYGWGKIAAIATGASIVGAALGYSFNKGSNQPASDPLTGLKQSVGTNIMFDTGSARLSQAAIVHLDDIAQRMRAVSGPVCITITGHSSKIGADAMNQSLSVERAQAVADQLVYGAHINPSLIKIESRGTNDPQGSTPAFDQRVETMALNGPCR